MNRRLQFCLGLALVGTTVIGGPACAQTAIDQAVRTQLRAALAPVAGQRIDVIARSDPEMFPNVLFFQGHRIPPFGTGEDPRPDLATLVIQGDDSALVTTLSDLERAWSVLRLDAGSDSARAVATVVSLLDLTGILKGELLETQEQALAQIPLWDLEVKAARDSVRAPFAFERGGAIVVRVYRDGKYSLDQIDFVIIAGSTLRVERTPLSRYRLRYD